MTWVPDTHGVDEAFDPTHNRTIDERDIVVSHGRHDDDVPHLPRRRARDASRGGGHEPHDGAAVPRLTEDVTAIDGQVFAVSSNSSSAMASVRALAAAWKERL